MIATSVAVVLALLLAPPAANAGDFHLKCRFIGNGDVCISIDRFKMPPWSRGHVTVWYHKHSGSPVNIRLLFWHPISGNLWDEGEFTIRAGENRGYIWSDVGLSPGCYISKIQVDLNPGLQLINGGTVCL